MALDDNTTNQTLARVEIALLSVKRVRNEANLVIRSLAALRDELQSEEDTSNNE